MTPLAYRLRWADEALNNLADEAIQRRSWFGLDPVLMDSPGEIICDLLPTLEGGFITDETLELSQEIQGTLVRIRDAIVAYQQEVGLDPDPELTIDHPTWREIRALAKQAHELLFGPQNTLLERAALDYDILSIQEAVGRRLYSHQSALRLLDVARNSGFGCLWIEEWSDRPGAQLGRHMTGNWTKRGIKHLGADWVQISCETALRFLNAAPTAPVPSFWIYLWRFRNEETAQ